MVVQNPQVPQGDCRNVGSWGFLVLTPSVSDSRTSVNASPAVSWGPLPAGQRRGELSAPWVWGFFLCPLSSSHGCWLWHAF